MKSVLVYKSPQVRVVEGANVGDELTFARELFLDDTYMLEPLARRERLSVRFETDGLFVGKKGEVGQSGQRLYVDCCVTFMSERGQTAEALVLVEVNDDEFAVAVYLMPLSKLDAKTRYTLIGVDSEKAPEKFAHTACVFVCQRYPYHTFDRHAKTDRRIERRRRNSNTRCRCSGNQVDWAGHDAGFWRICTCFDESRGSQQCK